VLRGGRIELGDAADLPLTIKTDPQPRRWSRTLRSARQENLGNCLHGCNVSMRHALLDQIGLYDEAHRDRSGGRGLRLSLLSRRRAGPRSDLEVQAVVSHAKIAALLPDDRPRMIAIATGLCAAGSSSGDFGGDGFRDGIDQPRRRARRNPRRPHGLPSIARALSKRRSHGTTQRCPTSFF
jgi:hypothetical protein